MNDYNCSCVAGYMGKNCSIGKLLVFWNLLFLLFFAIFVTQSFHTARKVLVTFVIFAKFAISSILF